MHNTFDVFDLRNQLIQDYSSYLRSFLNIQDPRIRSRVDQILEDGYLWPEPLIQMNPAFEPGGWIEDLIEQGLLHQQCARIFALKDEHGFCRPLRLHSHQVEAIQAARANEPYILTTGTGSGKSLSYQVPIVDWVLQNGTGRGIQAIIIYPMNALANSQRDELERFLGRGFPEGPPVRFERFTGQESDEKKNEIKANPPDILLTNYVMMELLLTRPHDSAIMRAASNLRFLVLDELHTYRGRQGADVALLVRRVRQRCGSPNLLCVGTSATLASGENLAQQKEQVAQFASRLFGVTIKPERVIGETLRRVTPETVDRARLLQRLQSPPPEQPEIAYEDFINDPLSSWVESVFGLTTLDGRLARARPVSIGGARGAAHRLAEETGLPIETCVGHLQRGFLRAYRSAPHPDTGMPPFAFKLHQFFSKGDTLYASLESAETRYLTLEGQQFVPGDRERVLLPLAFCRECGQEYYTVFKTEQNQFLPRQAGERFGEERQQPGFLFLNPDRRWPGEEEELDRVPEDWVEESRSGRRLKSSFARLRPLPIRLSPGGEPDPDGLDFLFTPAPFRFCLHCDVTYDGRQLSDLGKISTLDTSGRSTATTLLTLSVHRAFRQYGELLQKEARKLLSFTDNRQDASLQAGHFNDFVQVGWLRSALYRAMQQGQGITHEDLTHRVFQALDLDPEVYAQNPEAILQAKKDNERALREVTAYRIYRDQKRGWRVTFPNLEQTGLLKIQYSSLDELCALEQVWQGRHAALAQATPAQRETVARTLLDYLRRELALKVDYLDSDYQERLKQLSSQRLKAPWALDDQEPMARASVAFPYSGRRQEESHLYVSSRGAFARFLRRQNLPGGPLKLDATEEVIRQLFEVLVVGGLLERVREPEQEGGPHGYQIPASALVWQAGTGEEALHDPTRVARPPRFGKRVNQYFVDYYRQTAWETRGMRAHEHTAQVPAEERIKREKEFREGDLPVLFCSPTMELGVDIAQLNVVGLRNVPPTPANYAQRSGRAGRSGQPALVFTYCTAGSPHDQYFFRRPERMVAGSVNLPRLELGNEELLRAHVRAELLGATSTYLGQSLKEVLELNGDPPPLSLHESVRNDLEKPEGVATARRRCRSILDSLREDLERSDWHHESWLEEVLKSSLHDVDRACDRWRELYLGALRQMDTQYQKMKDHTATPYDRSRAQALLYEAKKQRDLLLETRERDNSDFYSYRYFAGEGLLPGYSFPRLPLSAFIPGRRDKDEYLSRPRFLAISEFGPRNVVYHEGVRYLVNRVILPVEAEEVGKEVAKRCEQCAYLHEVKQGDGPDLCQRCQSPLPKALDNLFRLRNVSTRRYDRIYCDEEERKRMGFELQVALQFETRQGRLSCRAGTFHIEGLDVARLEFGQAARIRRLNLGWKNRKDPHICGFNLDTERGYWAANEREDEDRDKDDPMGPKVRRVVPYVEDHRNCLLLEPLEPIDPDDLISLQWALKTSIQVTYQLEDNELAAETLPHGDSPRSLLFYEASEGGAGVLRRLVEDPEALARVAREALELCHFDPDTGQDRRRHPRSQEDCEAACYDCLLSYTNQRDHRRLDRKRLVAHLRRWMLGRVLCHPTELSRGEHLAQLKSRCDSELERQWLTFLEDYQLNLPTHSQELVPEARTRPDFLYRLSDKRVAIYVDGPPHDYPERQRRDREQQDMLEDKGWLVIRFGQRMLDRVAEAGGAGDWLDLVTRHAYLFGQPIEANRGALSPPDPDLYEPAWYRLLSELHAHGIEVLPGGDLKLEGRVVGSYVAELRRGDRKLRLLESDELMPACQAEGVPGRVLDPSADNLSSLMEELGGVAAH